MSQQEASSPTAAAAQSAAHAQPAQSNDASDATSTATAAPSLSNADSSSTAAAAPHTSTSAAQVPEEEQATAFAAQILGALATTPLLNAHDEPEGDVEMASPTATTAGIEQGGAVEADGDTSMQSVEREPGSTSTSAQEQRVISHSTSEATFDSTQLQLSTSSDVIAPLPSSSPFKSTSRSGGGGGGAQPSSPTARFHDPISARGGRSRGGRSGAAASSVRSSPALGMEEAMPVEEWKRSAGAGETLGGGEDGGEGEEEVDDGDATVDEEGGIIRCICGYDTDDGFTIQCEKCLVWQHCACFGMSQASVPDEYLCEACEPRLVNVAFAQQHQARRREAEARKVAEVTRRVSSGGAGAAAATTTGEGTQRGRKPSVSVIDTSVGTVDATSQAAQPATKTKRGKGTGNAKASRKTPALDTPTSAVARTPLATSASTAAPPSAAAAAVSTSATSTPNPAAARAEAEERAAEKAEAWHAEFTPVARNLVAEPRVLLQLAAAMAPYEAGALEALYAEPSTSARGVVVPLASEEIKNGLRAVGGECVPVVIEASNLASLAYATYVKHISDAAAAAVFANVLSIVPLPSEPSRPWTASRTFSRPTMHGLFADAPIPAGAFIAEYRGELSTSETYRRNPINQYAQLGATKPHVHLFPPPLGCAVDARRFGTESRFARSSCHPNAVVRPILFTRAPSATVVGGVEEELEDPFVSLGRAPTPHADEPELRFGLFALSDIPRTHEITLGWEWDDAHIVHLLPSLVKNPALGLPPPPTSGAEKGQQYLANIAAAKIQASSSLSVARTTERERRTAALAALAERGDFPYTNTRFGACMNAVLAVLLGATLCACIGSAAAPSGAGSSSASTHNARKQDCAIAQMLRLAHGMTLLNVHMPGNKSQRKVRLPDFAPLVGVKRAWRKLGGRDEREREDGERNLRERLELKGLNVPFRIAPGGKVGRVTEGDFLRAIAEAERAGSASRGELATMQYTTDEEMDDASVASSLTEPLSGLSDVEAEEMDEDLARLLQGEQSADAQAVAEEEEEEHQGSSILPFKKRVSGTRLKATYSGGEDSDAERAGAAGRRRASRALPLPRSQQKARAKAALANAHAHVAPASTSRRSSSAKRAHKRAAVAATTSEEESEDEESAEEAPRRPSAAAAKQKRRRTSKIAEPSSPLSSALSDEEDSLSDAPTTKRKNSKTSTRLSRTDEDDEEEEDGEDDDESDGELSEESSDGAATLKSAGGKSKKATPAPQQQQQHKGTSESLLRKRNAEALAAAKLAKARKQRKLMSLAHLGDTESSGDERKPVAASLSSSAVVGGKRARSPTKQNAGKAGKSKKPRLIVSSEEESEADVDASPSTIRDRTPLTTHEAQWGSTRSPSQGKTLAAQPEPVLAQVPAKAPSPPPAPKPEPPRAKLTLAEYKKRLAERRNNEASAAASEPAPSASASAAMGLGAEAQSTVSALLESLSPIKQEISRFAPPAPRPPRPLTPPRAGFPPVLAPSPAPALASAAVAAGAMHHQQQQQQQQQMYNPAAPSYAAVPNAGMYAPPQPAYSASLYNAAPVQGATSTHVAPRTPPFNAAGYAAPRPMVGGTPRPAAHQHQAGMLHHQQQQQQQQVQQQQQQGAYGLPPPLELGAAVTGVSPSSWGVGPSSLEAAPQQQQAPQAPPQPPPQQQQQQQQRAGFTPIRPGFRPIASTRGGAAGLGGMSAIRPVAPASFNPPRGPKALSNPLFAPPTPAFATPGSNAMTGVGSARPLAPTPLDMSTLPRRTHSGSLSNASAASMSPPSALGFQHHPAPPASNAGVGASPTLRASATVGDFSGVPKGPRAPMEEVREPRAPLPPGREASVEPGPMAISGAGAGGGGVQGFEEQAGAPGAPFVPGAGGFRGRGAWRPPGANTRGFVRGSGWGTRARGDHRGGGRGRGRGGWQ